MQKKLIKEYCSKYINLRQIDKVLKNKKILIAGASGFLGQWLVNILLFLNNNYNLNLRITIILRTNLKKNYYFYDDKYSSISAFKGDLCKGIRYKSKFDFFFHMAGNTIFSDNTEEKKSAMSSVKIIKNSIKLAGTCSVENFIFISSGAVYGKNSKRKLGWKEKDTTEKNKNEKENYYGKAKLKSEKMLIDYYNKSYNLKSLFIFRAFSFGGSGFRRKNYFAFDNFIKSRITKKNIILNSQGKSIRSFLHPIDFIIWLINILNKKKLIISNIGSENKIAIIKLANLIANKEHPGLRKVNVVIGHEKIEDNYVPDLKIAKSLGFKERISLDIQIKEALLNFYQK